MANNKAFIFKSLEALEAHGKIKEIYWLTESYFCEEKFKISWKDEIERPLPVLRILYPQRTAQRVFVLLSQIIVRQIKRQ